MILTNDITTLNGALTELGETLATNLTTQGVTASASDGLTTLAGKVLDIQGGGGGHCYNLKFSQDTYYANTSNNATLTLTLLDCGEPVDGASISLSNNFTVTTNSSGVATATVTITQDTVFTATYDEVTATCTVKKDALIFTIHNSYFKSYGTSSFTKTGTVTIDWGDGTTQTYSSGALEHTYSSVDDYTITITGNITSLSTVFRETYIRSIRVPSTVTTLSNYCFRDCVHLRSVTLPDTMTSISLYAFSGCYNLNEVNIPNVTSIGQNCFYGCYNLRNVTLPTTITTLDSNFFNSCYGLESISIPDNVTSIGSSCFTSCYGLASLEIGSKVTTIGTQWLTNAKSLRVLKFKSTTPPTISANSNNYQNVPTNCKIYVPSGTLSNYTSAANYPSSSTYTYVEY